MRSLGAADLVVLFVFVVLVFDSRRLHALVRSTSRARRAASSGLAIPAGRNADQVGLSLRHIQMRTHVDWQDGGLGWDGPEILPVDEPDDMPVDETEVQSVDAGAPGTPEPEPSRALPVLWKPFPALPAAGATGAWRLKETPALSHAGS